ncbi:MAG: flagellar biosynthesis protein FlaG [Clostridiales bacterium]|jgi:flagellar protein FlaG|nr:flagellar biosynthesis protein FlaG [Clostridiales bacterium]
MKIDSTDASRSVLPAAGRTTNVNTDENQIQTSKRIVETKELSHITEFERRELPVSDKVVLDAIERANKAISVSSRKFEYAIHEKTKEIMIKVIDADTNEIIREIPPEKVLDMVAKMWEMAGLIVDERR